MDSHLSPEGFIYYEHVRRGVNLNAISHQLFRDFTHAIVRDGIRTVDMLKSTLKSLHEQHTQVFPDAYAGQSSNNNETDVIYNERPCRVCGKKRCFNFLRQTRAGDEGATLMVYCEDCKREFHA